VSKVLCFLASSLALLLAAPAQATVQRAHVSAAFGSDANTTYNCDAVHPCRFFQAATTVVSSGGEVVALDSGGYGTVNITQSISLIAPAGVYAGISVFAGANGININTAGVNVTLQGLTINGMGGLHGVHLTNGSSLTIVGSSFSNFGMLQVQDLLFLALLLKSPSMSMHQPRSSYQIQHSRTTLSVPGLDLALSQMYLAYC
jgi:hypothetical protein